MQGFGEIVIYKSETGKLEIDVNLKDDSLWLSQRLIADVFNNLVCFTY